MRLLVIDSESGLERRYKLRRGALTFGFDRRGILQLDGEIRAFQVEDNGRNVLITDLGFSEPVRLGTLPLTPQHPMIWLTNQEVRLGNYVALWQPTGGGWRQRLSTWTPDRVSPIAILLAVALLLLGLGWLGFSFWGRQQTTLQNGAFVSNWLSRYSASLPSLPTATPMPTPVLTVTLTPMATRPLTVADPDNRYVVTPTATATPTATLTSTATDGSGVDGLSIAITHTMLPTIWESSLITLEVTWLPAVVPYGKPFWRLTEARWLNEQQSNGLHHVFVDVVDKAGLRIVKDPPTMRLTWTTGACEQAIDNRAPYWIAGRSYGADCPMYSAGKVYQLQVDGDGLPSDIVKNIGLGEPGERRNWDIRTSFLFVFQYTIHEKSVVSDDK